MPRRRRPDGGGGWMHGWRASPPGAVESAALATGVVRVNANPRAEPSSDARAVGLAKGGSQIRTNGTDASGQWLRVERGAEPDAFVAARLIQDLQPSGLECGRDVSIEICRALRSGAQDAQVSLPKPFETLEQAQAPGVQATSSRLAVARLSAAEVNTRLQQIKELRQALGELN